MHILHLLLVFRSVQDKPYGSVAATFYLLAEAERHRKLNVQVQVPQYAIPCQINPNVGGTGEGSSQSTTSRKVSVPFPQNNV